MPDMERSRKVWHDHLIRWGKASATSAKAVRNGTARPMVMAMGAYTPRERASLALEGAVRLVVSAYQVSPEDYIDWELDNLAFAGKLYRIGIEPSNPRPDGSVIAWDCACVLIGDYEEIS